ncbi:MAG: phospho-sugar mutase [Clostridiales Family XIII bacterium]|jgi:phosphoglucomutase|nr:phospho-sugar mutase [Clostridiales Family XIII bacterium]
MDITKELAQLESWLAQDALDPPARAELEALKARYAAGPGGGAADEIGDRFFRFMEFGTAGMRGVMGAGPNRINIHTIRKISQGYADYLNEISAGKGSPARAAIAYDNRRHSDLFAFEAACVFVANGIETHLFGRLSATPLLSFAARELACDGGVVVTASHNNKAYNGYKIYDSHGCQCMPDAAARAAAHIDEVDMWNGVSTVSARYAAADGDGTAYAGATPGVLGRMRRAAAAEPLLFIIPEDMERAYIGRVCAESLTPGALRDVKAVYTPLNGAGGIPVQAILKSAGIGKLSVVKEQEFPDPEFPTAPEPNPEKAEALSLGLALCEKLKAEGDAPDILIGTDPDADRLGAAVLHEGAYVRLSGNQAGLLLLDYIIACRERDTRMPGRPVFITTIVSTPITGEMAKKHGVETRKVLTGFKNIGDQMNKLEADGEANRYIFGFEESCGYCSGVYCRDKDAQDAALLLLEAAGVQKQKGKTLLDRSGEIYREYGYYLDGLDELVRPGEKGMREIAAIMAKLREGKTRDAFGAVVRGFTDYQARTHTDFKLGGVSRTAPVMDVPASDVVEFGLADGCRILARPSGTEPKLKIYYTGVGPTEEAAKKAIARMKQEIARVI